MRHLLYVEWSREPRASGQRVYLKKGFFGKKIEMLPFSKKRLGEF
jgi:hypothetical protein